MADLFAVDVPSRTTRGLTGDGDRGAALCGGGTAAVAHHVTRSAVVARPTRRAVVDVFCHTHLVGR